MLNIKIICVGKIKDKNLKNLTDEYIKRLTKYCKIEIIEIPDEKLPENIKTSDVKIIKAKESEKIKEKLMKFDKASIYFLDLTGKEYNSIEFSKTISNTAIYQSSTIVFVIGGSLGMTDELLALSKNKICFSKLTFPHQLIRLFLLEQLFRAFKIQNNETYHH